MKKIKTPTAVTTAVLTLITIFFWAGFEIFRSLTVKPSPVVAQEIVSPLDPTLDTKTLDSISQRTFLNDSDIGNTVASTTNTQPTTPTTAPTFPPAPFPTFVASSSAFPSPTATSSATATATPHS